MHGHHAACGALPARWTPTSAEPFQEWAGCERFARQYRCAGLHRVSSAARSGIVHHLSGPARYAHSNPSRKIKVGRLCTVRDQPISFLTPYGFTHPLTRTHVRLLGPCFKAGRMGAHRPAPEHARCEARRGACCRPRLRQRRLRGPLGGIYRPIGAAFPNNSTRRQRLRGATGSNAAGLTLSGAPFQELGPGPSLRRFSDYNSSARRRPIFKLGSSSFRTKAVAICEVNSPPHVKALLASLARILANGVRNTETSFRPISSRGLGRRFVTPGRRASARRLGRNLRSKTRWFGILQFTPSIAFSSFFIDHERDIRCESF
ncbi:hypothetical protein Bca101_101480 [Brassica carinata]